MKYLFIIVLYNYLCECMSNCRLMYQVDKISQFMGNTGLFCTSGWITTVGQNVLGWQIVTIYRKNRHYLTLWRTVSTAWKISRDVTYWWWNVARTKYHLLASRGWPWVNIGSLSQNLQLPIWRIRHKIPGHCVWMSECHREKMLHWKDILSKHLINTNLLFTIAMFIYNL
jgi:hypothetical protein